MSVSLERKAIAEGPQITWRHIDGPLMSWAGEMHWLTWRERIAIRLGISSVHAVAAKRFPHLERSLKTIRNEANIDAMLGE